MTPIPRRERARKLLGVLTMSAVLLAALLGGQRYLYCRAMGEVMSKTCACAHAEQDREGRTAIGTSNDCFEVRALSRLVSFTVSEGFAVPPAAFSTLLPVLSPAVPPPGALSLWTSRPIRAGPSSPAASRAVLMVFLI
jgi:hypothetical protein